MPDVETLTNITRYVGVLISIVGAFVVSPAGTALLFGRWVARVRAIGLVAWRLILKLLPWLRRQPPTQDFHATARGSTTSSGRVTATTRQWVPTAPVETRIELLHQHVEELHDLLAKVRQDMHRQARDAAEDRARIERDLLARIKRSEEQLQDAERTATETDARALPVLGLGVVLSGIPDDLARLPFVLWLLVTLITVTLTVGAVVSARRTPSRAHR